jgi:Spy/CpxP family protein refolding chaperone
MVDAYVVSNLQESLGLTDEQFVKLLPLVRRLQTDRRDYYLSRVRALREMRRLLGSGSATEAQVLDLLKEVKALDADGPAKTRKNLEAIDAALSPIQQAKFRVLELEVELRMRELMGRARPGARPQRE